MSGCSPYDTAKIRADKSSNITGGTIVTEVHYKPAFERADPDKKSRVIEAGIDQFSTYGFEKANINVIAKHAGISIGLMYKYFETKEDLFMTCLDQAIEMLESELSEAVTADCPMTERAEKLIRMIQSVSRKDSRLHKLYNEVSGMSDAMNLKYYAERIEGVSAQAYSGFLEQAKKNGEIRSDADIRMFAFFFDSLLVTLQFSYTVDYYKERFKVYCGEDILEDDDRVVNELVKFLESAFAFSRDDVERLAEESIKS